MENQHASSRLQDLKLLFPDEGWLTTLDSLLLNSTSRMKGMLAGKRRSSSLGSSQEFADYRPYIAGDDIRRIDWNLYGRTTKAYIRQYWDEQERSFHLYVDSSQSMRRFGENEQNKWLFALRMAASIGYIALQNEDRMTLSLYDERSVIEQLPHLYGKQAKFTMQQQLAQIIRAQQQISESQLSTLEETDAMRPFADSSKLPRRAGITWIFSDGLYEQGFQQLLSNFQARQQQVIFVHILHEEEINPTLEGELKLIDVETNAATEVAISSNVMERYSKGVTAFCQELRRTCESRGVAYYHLNCSDSLANGLKSLLLQGEQLRYR